MKFLLCISTTFFFCQLMAQRDCGSTQYWNEQLQDPQVRLAYNRAQAQLISLKEQENDAADEAIITIPVVVHVLYNTPQQNLSDGQIRSQLDVLNNDFSKLNTDISQVPAAFAPFAADTRIRFELAKVDPEGRATTGIIRKKTTQTSWNQDDKMKYSSNGGDDAWNNRNYLNIWVCNLNRSLLGYSTFPGAAADKDGVVIRTDVFGTINISSPVYNKGRTTTHEVAHWLNLKHLWGDRNCGDDGVDDTPQQQTYNSGCSSFPRVNPDGCNPNPDGDMFMNFMDFSDDACVLMFTAGQKQRMRNLFKEKGARSSILQSPALGEAWNNTPSPYEEEAAQATISVFPNPASSGITFAAATGAPLTVRSFVIYDHAGKRLMTGNNRSSVSVSRLLPGMYVIHFEAGTERSVQRFIKK
ncbi:MAG: M43 family zinc metalloprotease [Agriterribacter sp.]